MSEFGNLIEFHKARTQGNRRTSDDPYQMLAWAYNQLHPDAAGDRGPWGSKEAPPWNKEAPHSQSPAGEARQEIDRIYGKIGPQLEALGGDNPKAWALIRREIGNWGANKMEKDIDLQKLSPDLARLMAAAAGWAMSDDVVRSGGGSPRGEMNRASQEHFSHGVRQQELAREASRRKQEERRTAADRRRHERSMRRAMRTRKSIDDYPDFNKLQTFFSEKSDEYQQRTPVMLNKDHAPIPPRQGLMWDAVKHRWTRPQNVGKTVAEVQGSKRIRGTGTGVHERQVGGHGSGPTRYQQLGRRFKGASDSGIIKPHEKAHPAQRGFGRKGAAKRGRPKKR